MQAFLARWSSRFNDRALRELGRHDTLAAAWDAQPKASVLLTMMMVTKTCDNYDTALTMFAGNVVSDCLNMLWPGCGLDLGRRLSSMFVTRLTDPAALEEERSRLAAFRARTAPTSPVDSVIWVHATAVAAKVARGTGKEIAVAVLALHAKMLEAAGTKGDLGDEFRRLIDNPFVQVPTCVSC